MSREITALCRYFVSRNSDATLRVASGGVDQWTVMMFE